MNKKAGIVLAVGFIVGSIMVAYGFATLWQTFPYGVGTGLSATDTLPLGTIVKDIPGYKIFDDVIVTNDYAGIVTIAFDSTLDWQDVFDNFSIAIYSSDGVSGTVTGSPIDTIDITSATSTTFTVSASEEYDYKAVWTVTSAPTIGVTLRVSIS